MTNEEYAEFSVAVQSGNRETATAILKSSDGIVRRDMGPRTEPQEYPDDPGQLRQQILREILNQARHVLARRKTDVDV